MDAYGWGAGGGGEEEGEHERSRQEKEARVGWVIREIQIGVVFDIINMSHEITQ